MDAHPASVPPVSAAPRAGIRLPGLGAGLGRGLVVLYLSLMVMLPLAAVVDNSLSSGLDAFWDRSPASRRWRR